jgi:tetratricopeptide (TPR) repeat protein
MDPTFERALEHLTWAFRDLSRYDKMLDIAKRYVAVSGSTEAYDLLGEAYGGVEEFDSGLRALQQARELFPKTSVITGSIIDLYLLKGEYGKAELESKDLIKEGQPNDRIRLGYEKFATLYIYKGQYRKALPMFDKLINLHWQANDTVNAILKQMEKSVFLYEGLEDNKRAWSEAQQTFPYRKQYATGVYNGWFTILSCYHGDYDFADSQARTSTIRWWVSYIRTLINNGKRDFKLAETSGDSALPSAGFLGQAFVLYPLAQAQVENGRFDAALSSLNRLRKTPSNLFNRRPFYYPKSYYLAGIIYEKKRDKKLAIENFEKFLTLWKDADKDLPELIDAKSRLAKVKGVASK